MLDAQGTSVHAPVSGRAVTGSPLHPLRAATEGDAGLHRGPRGLVGVARQDVRRLRLSGGRLVSRCPVRVTPQRTPVRGEPELRGRVRFQLHRLLRTATQEPAVDVVLMYGVGEGS